MSMKTAFLVTNGNMGGTAGDATLILRRAKAMYEEKEIYTKILLLDPVPQGDVNRGDFYYSIETCASAAALKQRILAETPGWLILYGDKIQMMTAGLHRFLQKHRPQTKLVLDIQGAVEEKKEYAAGFLRRHVVYPVSKWSFGHALRHADAAFVVSDEIRDKCERACGSRAGRLSYYKVRCGFETLADVAAVQAYRAEFRAAKHLAESTRVFCYSGYRAGWQKVEDIIEHFRRFDAAYPDCYFAFFCNTDASFEALLKEKFPRGNYCVELLRPDAYFKSLCGCDVGYILRDYNETNRVAFPNKFSDYLSSGLVLALNRALPEPMRVIAALPDHYVDTDTVLADINGLFAKLDARAADYTGFVQASLDLGARELLYRAQVRKLTL